MSELPPDPSRLRAILVHLERQIAETDAVGIYLRLQRDAVRRALARAERPPQQSRLRRKPEGGGPLPDSALPAYVVEQKRTPHGPEPAVVHLADCSMIQGAAHRIRADEARAALTDPAITACDFCRPDTELGMDLA
ncbi:DUF6233 domain-containing protein [Streptomyces sp. NPDC001606]